MTRRHKANVHFRVGQPPGPRSKIVNLLRTHLFERSWPSPAPDPQIENFRAEFSASPNWANSPRFKLDWDDRYPCLNDGQTRPPSTAIMSTTRPGPRVLAATRPEYHIDISGYIYFGPLSRRSYRSDSTTIARRTCGSASWTGARRPDVPAVRRPKHRFAFLHACHRTYRPRALWRPARSRRRPEGDERVEARFRRRAICCSSCRSVIRGSVSTAQDLLPGANYRGLFRSAIEGAGIDPDRANDGDLVVDPGLELLRSIVRVWLLLVSEGLMTTVGTRNAATREDWLERVLRDIPSGPTARRRSRRAAIPQILRPPAIRLAGLRTVRPYATGDGAANADVGLRQARHHLRHQCNTRARLLVRRHSFAEVFEHLPIHSGSASLRGCSDRAAPYPNRAVL